MWCLIVLMTCFLVSCEKNFIFELPEANSKPDTSPPEADFSYITSPDDFMTIDFTDLSFESTTYAWDFGAGNTSTLRDPSLLEWGFEDNSLPDGSGDGRDSWRNSDLGGVIQITSSPVHDGDQAAKLTGDAADLRIGYQLISVSPDSDYTLKWHYTMKAEPGVITVAILDNSALADVSEVAGATIASVELTDNSDPNTYVEASLDFNSGDNSEVAIFFNNDGVSESRLDNFIIE